jgi:hypothetical protein
MKVVMKQNTKQNTTNKKRPRTSQEPQFLSVVNDINNQIRMLRALLPQVEGRAKRRMPLNNNDKRNTLRTSILIGSVYPIHKVNAND